MPIPEYMRADIKSIPATIIQHYSLESLVHKGTIYVEINKGMYGLPHAGILANNGLIDQLATHGYRQSQHNHGLFTHITRPVDFFLVVDDFG